MATVFSMAGVPHPRTVVLEAGCKASCIEEAVASLALPIVVKPADSSGSRGVTLVADVSEVHFALEDARQFARDGLVVIQEFAVGPEVSVELVCIDHEPQVVAITDKFTTDGPYFVEMAHSQPTVLPPNVRSAIERTAILACRALDLAFCAAHVEMKITESGPVVIEVGARLGGGLITSHLTPLSTGTDVVAAVADICAGVTPSLHSSKDSISAVVFLNSEAALEVNAVLGEEIRSLNSVVEVEIYRTGSKILRDGTDRSGHVVLAGDNRADVSQDIDVLGRLLPSLTMPEWRSRQLIEVGR